MRQQLRVVVGREGAALELEAAVAALIAGVDAQHRVSIAIDDRDAHEVRGDDVAHADRDRLDDSIEIEARQNRLVDVGKRRAAR